MSSSTPDIDLIAASQAAKEVTANALFNAASPAMLFGRRDVGTSLLTWAYFGGIVLVGAVLTHIANGALLLTANAINYVEATIAGVVSRNSVGFTAGSIPLYTVTTNATTVTTYIDHRRSPSLQEIQSGVKVLESANGKQGVAVLAAGTVTVANTSITASSRIFLTSQIDGGAVGFLRVSARVVAASFTITSSSATDTSTVAYEIFEPA